MRIGINATILDSKPTGLGNYTLNIIYEMCQNLSENLEIVVFTSEPSFFSELPITVVKVSELVQPKKGKVGGFSRFLWTQIRLPMLLKKYSVDIFYSTTHHGAFFTSKKQIITIHDILPIKYPKQYKLQYNYFKIILPILLKKTTKLVTVSNNTKKDLNNFYGYRLDDIKVIYNAYNKDDFVEIPNNSNKEKYILFVGASYPHKNLTRSLEAFIKIKDKYPDYKVIITGGRKEYLDEVKKSFQQIKDFDDKIQFIDYVPYKQLPDLYRSAELLLYPSLYEGFGIPPLEAMACGCPVITSDNSSIPEVCGDAAIYVNPLNSVEIEQALEKCLSDEKLRKLMIERGLKRCSSFDWNLSARELVRFIEETIN
ncbi:glycosyltransferase family 4 protein [Gracilibacillus massiliensis]|uniref:glycosyltransferase family 4 protein n=1 Tax=Gracilibacillus massiliensis TaxID=1564956 RepID=UPI00071D1F38|nr:glycosyltransferase family 1 protein [Gracilibacillus massiliensis]